ncbi:MAG TPA: hypothetical protein VKO84_08230 [Gaiellaceae bacterium]|nr:hypothetical protein [Gaiellaceae bacterium]
MPSRVGSKRAFRYVGANGKPIRDEAVLERIEALAIPRWFRVGSERYAREETYGVTTLLRRHVQVRGKRVKLSFPPLAGIRVRSELVDEDLADEIRGLLGSRAERASSSTAGRATSTT